MGLEKRPRSGGHVDADHRPLGQKSPGVYVLLQIGHTDLSSLVSRGILDKAIRPH